VKRFLLQFGICISLAAILNAQDPTGGDPTAGGGTDDAVAAQDPNGLTPDDVMGVIKSAATAVNVPLVIAVTNRQGLILAVYRKAGAPDTALNMGKTVSANELAVGLARTASLFSHNQAPLTSRTVRFISGIHFPPGIMFVGPADLYGIELTNRGCSFNVNTPDGDIPNLPRARSIDGTGFGTGIVTGKKDRFDSDPGAVNPGGIPLFKNHIMVGGVGVVGPDFANAEFAAAVASITPPFNVLSNVVPPNEVIVGGLSLPEIFQLTPPPGTTTGAMDGSFLPTVNSPTGAPIGSPAPVPEGDLIPQHASNFPGGLTAADVATIVTNSVTTANSIRGVIRLPLGARAKMVISVADLDGSLLALYRMPDATIFSVDVAVAKSKNVIYFTQNPAAGLPGLKPGTAVTNRTIEWGSQPIYPPGIDYGPRGPYFDLFQYDFDNPCTQGLPISNPSGVFNPANNGGIVFFPGSTPLYKNGVLVGGLGISGDGVDQDDFVTNGGSIGYQAALGIRADNFFLLGARLPYAKFPRDPYN
jgi:uncharacterized protein GlcG (DUF336 family)